MSIIKTLIINGKRILVNTFTDSTDRSSPTPRVTSIRSTSRKLIWQGRVYSIKLIDGSASGKRNAAKLSDDTLSMTLNPMTRENMAAYFESWYRRQARREFESAVARWIPEFEQRGYAIAVPRLKLFRMRRAWGRCYYTKGLITINLHLAKTPRECIEYIIAHELCHFVVHNHSAEFYALLESFLPQWRTVDAQLKAFARQNMVIK